MAVLRERSLCSETRTVISHYPSLLSDNAPSHSLVFNTGFREFPKATDKMCGRNVMYEKRQVISSMRRKMFEAVAKEQPYFNKHKVVNF
jgi:hypothetical protein